MLKGTKASNKKQKLNKIIKKMSKIVKIWKMKWNEMKKNLDQKADIGHSSTGAKICFTLYDFKSNWM
jgi:hypothetical protein